ncbi:MAG: hypothetical protein M0Q91_07530 [Methanoregula sp.]|nr:hypothetical protein [Methanoregula sp.]
MIARCPRCKNEQATFADPQSWSRIRCIHCGERIKATQWTFREDEIVALAKPPLASDVFFTGDQITKAAVLR